MVFDLSHVNQALTEHDAEKVHGIIGADILKKGKAIIAKISSSNDRLIYFNEIKYWLLENDIFFFCAFERSSKSSNMQNINVLFKKFLILLI